MTNALLTLADAKDYLDIPTLDTSQDARVTSIIQALSDHFEAYCERQFTSQAYTHLLNGDDTPGLILVQFPVTAIASIYIDRLGVFGSETLVPSSQYAIHRDVAVFRRLPGIWPKGQALSIKATYTAGYTTIPGDLAHAARITLDLLFRSRDQQRFGANSRTKLGEATAWTDKLPEPVLQILNAYVRETYLKRKIAEF